MFIFLSVLKFAVVGGFVTKCCGKYKNIKF
jgi:hypothetical protein